LFRGSSHGNAQTYFYRERTLFVQCPAQPVNNLRAAPAFAAHRHMWRCNITVISLFCRDFLSSHYGRNPH